MKLVDRKTFLEMPDGIIFSYWNEKYDGITNLYRRYQALGNDFVVQNLLFEPGFKYSDQGFESITQWVDSIEKGNSEYNDFDCAGRDGMFDDKQRFIVYDEIDIKNLIAELQDSITDK